MRKYAQAYSRKLEQSDTLEPEREERVKTTWCLFVSTSDTQVFS